MSLGRSVPTSAWRFSIVAGCVAVLAACSPVTYGTGTPTGTQTLQDAANILDFTPDGEAIVYQERPGLQTPPTANLPPPQPATQTQQQPTQLTPVQQQSCAIAPGQVAPPPEYCTPNPNAPAVVADGAGFLGATPGQTGIREPANVCSWYSLTWAQMTDDERAEWSRLGWTAGNWGSANASLWPASSYATWRDLTFAEKRAARALGFEEASWGACV